MQRRVVVVVTVTQAPHVKALHRPDYDGVEQWQRSKVGRAPRSDLGSVRLARACADVEPSIPTNHAMNALSKYHYMVPA